MANGIHAVPHTSFVTSTSQLELRDLFLDGHDVAADAAGEAALRAERELFERRELCRFVDPALQLILALELAVLGRHQAENRDLALRQEAQRFETASARTVVFEIVDVDVDAVEQQFGDRVVTAFRDPRAGEIAAAQMHRHYHVLRRVLDRLVEHLGVGLG